MKKYNNIIFALTSSFLLILGCREELELETNDFESALVVEATITNELKHQEVKLSRTFLLEEGSEQILENNADVKIVDNTGNSYNFSQDNQGVYISNALFEAMPNVEYTLIINTLNGETYSSNKQTLTPISQIDNLYPEVVDDDVNGPGVKIFVDSNNPNSETKYFRYEYEETYKIIVLYGHSIGMNFSNFNEIGTPCGTIVFYVVEFFEKTEEEETCYNSNRNSEIIQTTSNDLAENNISRFPIRFLAEDVKNDTIDTSVLRERYSILVKQYVQSIEAFNYYKIISLFGNNESILSESQPGFVQGNINNMSNNDSRVIGFFEVASVSKKRIFFNYEDVNIDIPNYIYECDLRVLDFFDNAPGPCDGDENDRHDLYLFKERENYRLVNYDESTDIYTIAREECVNCTSVGTNIQPDFWID